MSAPVDYAPVTEATGSGDFMIGGVLWPGLSKLLEEAGEVIQVGGGKLMGSAGNPNHWSGDLRQMFVEELGDMLAAIDFFVEQNGLDVTAINHRNANKLTLFRQWHREALWQRSAEQC